MNDFNNIHALYHSSIAKEEIERRKRNYEVINTDFLQDLPMVVRDVLDRIKWDYGNRKWFAEAWEKYRKMVLDAGLGGKIKMPGAVFNEYLDKYELKELEKMYDGTVVAYHSDMYVDDYIEHHGIKGQKWGVRRFQNEDGTLTKEGIERYGYDKKTGQMTAEGAKLYKKETQIQKNIDAPITEGAKTGLKTSGLIAAGAVAAGAAACTGVLLSFLQDKDKDIPDIGATAIMGAAALAKLGLIAAVPAGAITAVAKSFTNEHTAKKNRPS